MSSIGLAAIGGNAAVNGMRVQQDREKQDERFGWERQRNQADLSTLDARTQSVQSGAELQAKRNTGALGLVDGQVANDQSRQELESANLSGAKSRQPDELIATANKAKVSALLSEFDVADLPRVIAQKKASGAISEADVFVASISKLGDLLDTDSPEAVVRFMNGMNEAGALENKHAPVASVSVEEDKQHGRVLVAKDANGEPVVKFSASMIRRIRDSRTPTKYEKLNGGDSLVAIKNGKASLSITAPDSEKSKANRQGPLERDVDYLVSAHGMTPEQALNRLNSAKTMSREQFILKSASDAMTMNGGKEMTEEQIKSLGTLYDSATTKKTAPQGNSGVASSESNSPAPNNNQRINSLLGIP